MEISIDLTLLWLKPGDSQAKTVYECLAPEGRGFTVQNDKGQEKVSFFSEHAAVIDFLINIVVHKRKAL